MPHFKFIKKKNTHNTLGRMNNNNTTTAATNTTTTTSHDGINAGGLPTNIDVRSVRKNDGKEKKNWKNILLRLHQTILSDTTICCSIRKNQRKRNKNINSQDVINNVNNVCMDDEIKMDYVNDDDKENNLNNENNNIVKEIIDDNDNIMVKLEEDSRDLVIESSSNSINIDQIQSIKQDNSENLVKKASSRFISISNTKNIDSPNISRDDEFDLNDKSKMTLLEKCATIPRRSSETEVLIKKGRFTVIREANNNYSISRSYESNKSLPSSYSSCSSSCSSLPVSLFESPVSLKGSTKIRKNSDHLVLTSSIHSNSPLSSISPCFSNSQMCSSPLSSSFTFHSENINKNPRRASDSVAHHYKISSQHDNISNNKQLSIIPLQQRSHVIHQHSPTSSPHTSPNTTPTSTLVSPLSKSFSSTSTIIKPNNTQSNRDSNPYPDTPHSTTSTISTTTSIVSTHSGRIFELEGSYFPNNSVSPSSPVSNNNNLSSKRRRKFIIETCE